MAETTNTIETKVVLDSTAAQIEIAKLNGIASDSTRELEERVAAKNKQIKIQNELSEKNINQLKKEVKELTGVEGKEKDLKRATDKLNKAKIRETKISVRNEKVQKKLVQSYDDSKNSLSKLNEATGGFIDKLKLLATNPIVLVMTLIVGVFQTLKKAIERSEKATESFAKVGAFLSGMLNGVIAVLEPLVELLGETLVSAIEKPGEAWDSFVGVLQSGYEVWKTQILDRFIGNLKILSGTFEKGVLKMRIAWNEFTGDSEEAEELEKALDEVNKKIEEGYEAHKKANEQLINGFNAAKGAIEEFAKKAKENYEEASKATLDLANAERQLVKNRISLEKQQLTSLKLAEEQRQVRDDISKTFPERIKANKELGKVLDEQAKKELSLARQNLNLAQLKQQAEGDSISSLEAVGDAEIKLLEIQERITGQRSEQLVNEQALKKEQLEKEKADSDKIAADKKAQDKIDEDKALKKIEDKAASDKLAREQDIENDEIELERKRLLGEATLQQELDLLKKKSEHELLLAGEDKAAKLLIENKYNLAKEEIQKLANDAEKRRTQDLLDAGIAAAGEAFGIGKELSIATALVNTYKGISEVWASKSETGLVGAGFIQKLATSAVTAVQGFNTVKKIIGTTGPKGSSKRGSSGGGLSGGSALSAGAPPISQVGSLASNNVSRLGGDSSLVSNASNDAANSARVTGSSGTIIFSESSYQSFQDQITFRNNTTSI
jgi:hypothetical protein